MIFTYYQTQGKMPNPSGKGHANGLPSAQPAAKRLNPGEKITLSLYFGGI
jgi:hypothetical protein